MLNRLRGRRQTWTWKYEAKERVRICAPWVQQFVRPNPHVIPLPACLYESKLFSSEPHPSTSTGSPWYSTTTPPTTSPHPPPPLHTNNGLGASGQAVAVRRAGRRGDVRARDGGEDEGRLGERGREVRYRIALCVSIR